GTAARAADATDRLADSVSRNMPCRESGGHDPAPRNDSAGSICLAGRLLDFWNVGRANPREALGGDSRRSGAAAFCDARYGFCRRHGRIWVIKLAIDAASARFAVSVRRAAFSAVWPRLLCRQRIANVDGLSRLLRLPVCRAAVVAAGRPNA